MRIYSVEYSSQPGALNFSPLAVYESSSLKSGKRNPAYHGPLFQDGCAETLFFHGSPSIKATWMTPVATDTGAMVALTDAYAWPATSESMMTTYTASAAGTFTRTYDAKDGYAVVDQCVTKIVVVEETLAPTLTCPSDVTVQATAGRLDTTVSFTVPSGASASHDSGSAFHIGVTKVFLYSSTEFCSFTITVQDRTEPSNGGAGIVYLKQQDALYIKAGRRYRQMSWSGSSYNSWLADHTDDVFLFDLSYWDGKVTEVQLYAGVQLVFLGDAQSFTAPTMPYF
jgi:hypothetical protein